MRLPIPACGFFIALLTPLATLGQTNTFPSSGNVGIGTTNPGSKLTIAEAGNSRVFDFSTSSIGAGYQYGLWMNTGGAMLWGLESSVAGGVFYGSTAYSSVWGTNNTTSMHFSPNNVVAMTIQNGGNVGIGTTTPGAPLTINRAGFDTYIQLQEGGTNTAQLESYSSDMYLTVAGSHDIIFRPNSGEKMRITSAGNVAIGTTSPGFKLDLFGNANPDGIRIAAVTPIIRMDATDSNANARNWVHAVGYNASGDYALLQSTARGGDPYAAGMTRLEISQSGNVGIGTTNPTQKLSVNGTIQAKEVVVQTGWSDYVFDDGYKLKALSEVEAYIKVEKHLPGIPSAKEVAEHGVSVGEMESKLLAKLEELTLHQIEQEKQLRALKQQNEELLSRLKP